jgi:RimJ/RimL family protein N-acetyltransferase
MVVRFRPYEENDVYAVKLRAGDAMGTAVMKYDGPAWTMVNDKDEPIACYGVSPITEKIGFLWAFISDEARGNGIKMIKEGRKMINHALSDLGLHRVQSIVRADRPEYKRFSLALGLECEGLMRKAADNGQDIWLFAKVT